MSRFKFQEEGPASIFVGRITHVQDANRIDVCTDPCALSLITWTLASASCGSLSFEPIAGVNDMSVSLDSVWSTSP